MDANGDSVCGHVAANLPAYLDVARDGVRTYACSVNGLGTYKWCTPRLIAVANAAADAPLSVRVTADTGAIVKQPLVADALLTPPAAVGRGRGGGGGGRISE